MTPPAMLSAEAVIDMLGLAPHPEGGHYRQTFSDSLLVDGRPASTAIYYLLAAGEGSMPSRSGITMPEPRSNCRSPRMASGARR